MPSSEVINLHMGQAGCQLGTVCWELLCLEHKIRPDGTICPKRDESNLESFFSWTGADKVLPRAAFIDLEPTVIDEIRTGRYRSFYSPQLLISGKEDAASCFARAYLTLARDILELILNRIRVMAESCSKIEGFLLYRAYGGGTGSGLATRVLEQLSQDYPKTNVFEFAVYPSPKLSTIIVEPYNTALSLHESLEYTTGSFVVDNDATYDICDRLLDLRSSSYQNINRLLAQVVSGVTSSFRFPGSINVNFNELKTNLIPFPRVQYPIISYAPLLSKKQILYDSIPESAILKGCFERANQFAKCEVAKGKYMALTVLFRGDINIASVNAAIASIKEKKSIKFVEWCPSGVKVGVNSMRPVSFSGGDLAEVNRACLMLANCTAVKGVWSRINHKFDLMFAKKAFLHTYIREGLEEADFEETRLDLAALESDYLEVESN